MHTTYPNPPMITWTTTNTSSGSNVMPAASAHVQMPYQATPSDVERYLTKMEFEKHWVSSQEYWKRPHQDGYMTWEQAVVYCLVKPWLE